MGENTTGPDRWAASVVSLERVRRFVARTQGQHLGNPPLRQRRQWRSCRLRLCRCPRSRPHRHCRAYRRLARLDVRPSSAARSAVHIWAAHRFAFGSCSPATGGTSYCHGFQYLSDRTSHRHYSIPALTICQPRARRSFPRMCRGSTARRTTPVGCDDCHVHTPMLGEQAVRSRAIHRPFRPHGRRAMNGPTTSHLRRPHASSRMRRPWRLGKLLRAGP